MFSQKRRIKKNEPSAEESEKVSLMVEPTVLNVISSLLYNYSYNYFIYLLYR
jgi:hypothetical protein